MISDEVVAYVRTAQSQGAAKEVILAELSKAGWTSEQIAEIFEKATPVPPEMPTRLESPANIPTNQPAITTSTMEPNTTPTMNTGGAPKKSSSMGVVVVFILIVLVILGGGGAYVYLNQNTTPQDSALDAQDPGNQNNGASGAEDLVDQRNAFDAAIEKPVLSDGQRLGSVLHQFSAVVPKGWGIVATSSDGYLHFDVINAQTGAAGGVIRISRYLTLYPEAITLKEIADKERQDLKARAEGFTERGFTTETIAGRETYVIKAGSTFNDAAVEITAYLFLDKGRYFIVTGIAAGDSTSADFGAALKTVVDSFEIAAI